jgi:hypothetical protein
MSERTLGARIDRFRDSGAALTAYFRRLVTPPLPGDGLLLVGFLEGVIGWGGSWAFISYPVLAPVGPVLSVVALWAVLTAGIVFIGVAYTAPTVRRNRVWMVWGVLNLGATLVNVVAVAGVLPPSLAVYGYWHPWFLAIGLGYLATAFDNWESPQLRKQERIVYALSGAATLLLLAVSVLGVTSLVLANVFLVGGAIQLVPIGHDVVADAVLVARRQ